MRVDPKEFNALELEVHSVLKGVPLQDVSAIDLPGGGPGRTIEDLQRLLEFEKLGSRRALVRALFALRRLLGRLFGWDRDPLEAAKFDTSGRVSPDLRARSLRAAGTSDGPFRLLYQLEDEALSEISNATVHAFSCMVLREQPEGYRFYWAIYVKPVSRFTPFYMALIEPFRRFIVYPGVLRELRKTWIEKMAS